jgi:flagellar assembly protein FliH
VKNSSDAVLPDIVSVITAETLGKAAQLWAMPSLEPPKPLPTAAKLQEIESAAYEEGFARGKAEGYAAGAAIAREQAERLKLLMEALASPLADFDAEVESALVALAIEVARRLTNAQIDLDPAVTAGVVREALEALGDNPRDARVHLNPAELESLRGVLTPPSEGPKWRFVADASLHRGDCRIVTEGGSVDARLDTREASISRGLLGDRE